MSFRLSGVFMFQYANRQFLALLFQLPPRFTRFEAFDLVPTMTTEPQRKRLDRRARALISIQNGGVLISSSCYYAVQLGKKIFSAASPPSPQGSRACPDSRRSDRAFAPVRDGASRACDLRSMRAPIDDLSCRHELAQSQLSRKRKPRSSSRWTGEYQIRLADRQFPAMSNQHPPRITRYEAVSGPFGSTTVPVG